MMSTLSNFQHLEDHIILNMLWLTQIYLTYPVNTSGKLICEYN